MRCYRSHWLHFYRFLFLFYFFARDWQWIPFVLWAKSKLQRFAGLYLLCFGSAWSSGLLLRLNIRALNCKPTSTRRWELFYYLRIKHASNIWCPNSDVNNILFKVDLSHSCYCEKQSERVLYICAMQTVMLSRRGLPALQTNNAMTTTHKLKRETKILCFQVKPVLFCSVRLITLKTIPLFSPQSWKFLYFHMTKIIIIDHFSWVVDHVF